MELEELIAAVPDIGDKAAREMTIARMARDHGAAVEHEKLRLDAFGEPRTRYVRVTLDGSHCVMHPSEGDTYIKDAKDAGDDSKYTVADVYLSEREFDCLPEHPGF